MTCPYRKQAEAGGNVCRCDDCTRARRAAEAPVIVIFRKWRDGAGVIALMPALPATVDGRYCTSYMHVGQHSAASYPGVIAATVPAEPEEYAPLLRELTSAPYRYVFEIRKRWQPRRARS